MWTYHEPWNIQKDTFHHTHLWTANLQKWLYSRNQILVGLRTPVQAFPQTVVESTLMCPFSGELLCLGLLIYHLISLTSQLKVMQYLTIKYNKYKHHWLEVPWNEHNLTEHNCIQFNKQCQKGSQLNFYLLLTKNTNKVSSSPLPHKKWASTYRK